MVEVAPLKSGARVRRFHQRSRAGVEASEVTRAAALRHDPAARRAYATAKQLIVVGDQWNVALKIASNALTNGRSAPSAGRRVNATTGV